MCPFLFSSSSKMASADSFSVCLMTTMDRLWFHQTILIQTDPLADSPLLLAPLSDKPVSSETSSDSLPQLPQTHTSSVSLPTGTLHQDDEEEEGEAERPTRVRVETKRVRSHSSSPCTQRRHGLKNLKYSSSSALSGIKLEKTASCRTLGELELEEVKGFMDLGFVFKKEDLNPRVMNLVPGLQRIGSLEYKNKLHIDVDDEDTESEEQGFGEDVKNRGVMRPYLSEAWLIKRPDSPLLNMRVPRNHASSDDVVMKQHLRFWAKTVGLVMRQEVLC